MLASVFSVAVLLAIGQTPLLITSGQSLSQGLNTGSALSTTQPYSNTMVSGLTQEISGTGTRSYETYPPTLAAFPWTNLIEGSSIESPRSGAANYYSSVTGRTLHVVTGSRGGSAYTQIKKGTQPFGNLAASIEAANSRGAGGATCVALYVEHGEADHQLLTTRAQYAANLVEFQSDVSSKCQTSARGGNPPLYIAQFSSWTADLIGGATTSVIPLAVYDAARQNHGNILLVGPHYQWTHAADEVHLTAASSRAMGALAGKAIATGRSWQPLWPRLDGTAVSRTTNVITVYLYTPVPPLVVDTTNITGVSATTRGFEYTDDSSPPSITAVDCSAACSGNICSCQITLSGTPTGANKKLRYAHTGTAGNAGGPTSGPRGNIRDSDTATWQGANLYNWLVHFEESVP